MRNKVKFLAVAFILIACLFTGCTDGGGDTNPPAAPVIEVVALQQEITLKDSEVLKYDFTKVFKITSDGQNVAVTSAMLDTTKLKEVAGTYTVTCTYQKKSAEVKVIVTEPISEVKLSQSEIKLNVALWDQYNYLDLFEATIDGKNVEITSSMVEHNLEAKPGTYYYKVTFNGVSKTLTVHLTDEHNIEVFTTYKTKAILINEIAQYDYTELFSLYVDGVAEKVTLEMLDLSKVSNPQVGNTYEVTFNYAKGSTKVTKSAQIIIVEEDQISVTTKNVVTYPNGGYVDLTTLFEIKKGEEVLPIDISMIEGTINYSAVGVNEITLTYEGQQYISTVEVKRGVIIDFTFSDTVIIVKGTNQSTYDFIKDFKVLINGIRFASIPEDALNCENVDFNTPGSYQAILTIAYNENKLGLSGVKFTYYEQTINYVVVDNNYTVDVKDEELLLPKGTTKYNLFNNLNVVINGRNQTLTDNKNYVDIITCYAEVLSNAIDFTSAAKQDVKIAVYANGVNQEPVIVEYTLRVLSDVTVEATDLVVFAGTTVYTKDLFTISSGSTSIEVSNDYITGKVDTFTPGAYHITINYLGIEATSKVVVLDNNIKGHYKTNLKTIAVVDEDEEYGTTVTPSTTFGDLIIDDEGNIKVNNINAKLVSAIDGHTLIISIRSYLYTLYYEDGIIVLDPDNSIKLGFNDDKRPLVYFNSEKYELLDRVEINTNDSHVLLMTYSSYSIDVFTIKDKITEEEFKYGLKVRLAEKMGSDTIYTVSWGMVEYVGEIPSVSDNGCIIFEGEEYKFNMTSAKVGKILAPSTEKKYTNMNFSGTIDGQSAVLRANQYEGFTLVVGTKIIFEAGSYEISNMKNGGPNYEEDTVFLYQYQNEYYSYKFNLDTVNKTFTVVERDPYYGYYEYDNVFIFLDGYGTGLINYDKKHYYVAQFTYEVNGNTIVCDYFNTGVSFTHGEGFEFYVGDFLNTLTITKIDEERLVGQTFKNKYIVSGALVNIKSYQVGQDSDSIAKKQLYSNIEIITKDGELTETEKAKLIDTSRIRFNTPGFYQMTITINVNGQNVTSYYAVQILEAIYADKEVVATYGSGVIFSENSLSIDKYGQAILECSGIIYTGTVKINDDNSFIISAANVEKGRISATGTYITNGVVLVRCGGASSFTDYFTVGSYKATGCEKNVLRAITVGSNTIYVLANTTSAAGEIVSVELISGSNILNGNVIVKITSSEKEVVARIDNWSSVTNGLVIADAYRGSYTLEGNPTLTLDGFGNAVIGSTGATYVLNGKYVTVITNTDTFVYRLDNDNYTYTIVEIALDNSLLAGKTFSGVHSYFCGNYIFNANTTFEFGENSVVTIKSTSSEHDEGDFACGEDQYNPSFASKTGVKGTYSVNGNKVVITVNGENFTFIIDNVMSPAMLKCSATTISSTAHGYFAVGTTFDIE